MSWQARVRGLESGNGTVDERERAKDSGVCVLLGTVSCWEERGFSARAVSLGLARAHSPIAVGSSPADCAWAGTLFCAPPTLRTAPLPPVQRHEGRVHARLLLLHTCSPRRLPSPPIAQGLHCVPTPRSEPPFPTHSSCLPARARRRRQKWQVAWHPANRQGWRCGRLWTVCDAWPELLLERQQGQGEEED